MALKSDDAPSPLAIRGEADFKGVGAEEIIEAYFIGIEFPPHDPAAKPVAIGLAPPIIGDKLDRTIKRKMIDPEFMPKLRDKGLGRLTHPPPAIGQEIGTFKIAFLQKIEEMPRNSERFQRDIVRLCEKIIETAAQQRTEKKC